MVQGTFANEIAISNLALNIIGVPPIQAFTEPRREAELLQQNYEMWVQCCLSEAQWTFAKDVGQCNKLAQCPIPQWSCAYKVPNDLITLVEVYRNITRTVHRPHPQPPLVENAMAGDRMNVKDYKLFYNNVICTEYDKGLWVHYVKRVPEANWPAKFCDYVSCFIATKLALPLGRQTELLKVIGPERENAFFKACMAEADQSVPDCFESNSILRAREGF